jgi:CRISPR/Cas system CSM-associated protein Csm2 small subunit
VQPTGSRESTNRRARIACKICGRPIDIARMREHLRLEHQVDSSQVETLYLNARVEARRAQRSRGP